ncbi:hypothetical protein T10_11791 [Trichinella papuae]|uniref:Uncharacterized protein n=1 Tax=Trichinella papuae TaxID=268474 RepID=A0A0V1N1Q6_9BILA|nr:hypothetical protein T10_11791 [Trichinella papuae]
MLKQSDAEPMNLQHMRIPFDEGGITDEGQIGQVPVSAWINSGNWKIHRLTEMCTNGIFGILDNIPP